MLGRGPCSISFRMPGCLLAVLELSSKMGPTRSRRFAHAIGISGFGFLSDFGFRVSDFAVGISDFL